MKLQQIVLIAGLLGMLAGCDKSFTMRSALDQASRIGDPYEASQLLAETLNSSFEYSCPIFVGCTDAEVEAAREMKKQRSELLVKAANLGDARAIKDIYYYFITQEIRQQAAPGVLLAADQADASEALLLAAGNLVHEGKYAQTDYKRALSYYARAWKLGSAQAANGASAIFFDLHDFDNTYLWSLRCMSECTWFDKKTLEALPAQRIVEMQRLALDKSVIVLGNSPLRSVEG